MSLKKILTTALLGLFSLAMVFTVSMSTVHAGKYDQILDSNGSVLSTASNISSTGGMSNTTTVPGIIGSVIKVILGVSGTVALIFIIWGGIKWMISKGDDKQITEARKLMVSGMVGIFIIAAAYAITDFVIKQITVVAGA